MAVIDADAHVVEWERTWEFMDESERAVRPRVMVFKDAAQKPSSQRASEYWMIGGRSPLTHIFFLFTKRQAGWGCDLCARSQGNLEMFDIFGRGASLAQFKFDPINLFASLIGSQLPQKFPDLRWAFVEVSAEWLPYVMNHLEIGIRRRGKAWQDKELLKENHIYVACQTSDDLPYILEHVGDNHLVIGTDYGHNDTASEINALRKLKTDGKIAAASIDKILGDNAQALYAL